MKNRRMRKLQVARSTQVNEQTPPTWMRNITTRTTFTMADRRAGANLGEPAGGKAQEGGSVVASLVYSLQRFSIHLSRQIVRIVGREC
jgi:hypothetical protein